MIIDVIIGVIIGGGHSSKKRSLHCRDLISITTYAAVRSVGPPIAQVILTFKFRPTIAPPSRSAFSDHHARRSRSLPLHAQSVAAVHHHGRRTRGEESQDVTHFPPPIERARTVRCSARAAAASSLPACHCRGICSGEYYIILLHLTALSARRAPAASPRLKTTVPKAWAEPTQEEKLDLSRKVRVLGTMQLPRIDPHRHTRRRVFERGEPECSVALAACRWHW